MSAHPPATPGPKPPRPSPAPFEQLDLLLAEHYLDGGFRGNRLLEWRSARDKQWLQGLLALRGVHVTDWDLEACLRRTSGRFLPDQPVYRLIHGLQLAIDWIDAAAELGTTPDLASLETVHATVTGELVTASSTWRQSAPADAWAELDHPPAESLPRELSRWPLGRPRATAREMHPVAASAAILQRVNRLAPFCDYNREVAILAAGQSLLAHGYPPFLPQLADLAELRTFLDSPLDVFATWFARIVLSRFVALAPD